MRLGVFRGIILLTVGWRVSIVLAQSIRASSTAGISDQLASQLASEISTFAFPSSAQVTSASVSGAAGGSASGASPVLGNPPSSPVVVTFVGPNSSAPLMTFQGATTSTVNGTPTIVIQATQPQNVNATASASSLPPAPSSPALPIGLSRMATAPSSSPLISANSASTRQTPQDAPTPAQATELIPFPQPALQVLGRISARPPLPATSAAAPAATVPTSTPPSADGGNLPGSPRQVDAFGPAAAGSSGDSAPGPVPVKLTPVYPVAPDATQNNTTNSMDAAGPSGPALVDSQPPPNSTAAAPLSPAQPAPWIALPVGAAVVPSGPNPGAAPDWPGNVTRAIQAPSALAAADPASASPETGSTRSATNVPRRNYGLLGVLGVLGAVGVLGLLGYMRLRRGAWGLSTPFSRGGRAHSGAYSSSYFSDDASTMPPTSPAQGAVSGPPASPSLSPTGPSAKLPAARNSELQPSPRLGPLGLARQHLSPMIASKPVPARVLGPLPQTPLGVPAGASPPPSQPPLSQLPPALPVSRAPAPVVMAGSPIPRPGRPEMTPRTPLVGGRGSPPSRLNPQEVFRQLREENQRASGGAALALPSRLPAVRVRRDHGRRPGTESQHSTGDTANPTQAASSMRSGVNGSQQASISAHRPLHAGTVLPATGQPAPATPTSSHSAFSQEHPAPPPSGNQGPLMCGPAGPATTRRSIAQPAAVSEISPATPHNSLLLAPPTAAAPAQQQEGSRQSPGGPDPLMVEIAKAHAHARAAALARHPQRQPLGNTISLPELVSKRTSTPAAAHASHGWGFKPFGDERPQRALTGAGWKAVRPDGTSGMAQPHGHPEGVSGGRRRQAQDAKYQSQHSMPQTLGPASESEGPRQSQEPVDDAEGLRIESHASATNETTECQPRRSTGLHLAPAQPQLELAPRVIDLACFTAGF